MINAELQDQEIWRPLVSAMRAGAARGTAATEFRGTISPGGFGGSILDDGESRRGGGEVMDALGPLAALAGDRVAIRAVVTDAGDARVAIVEGGSLVSLGMGSEILETVLLVPDSDPEPYRRRPVRFDGVTTSPGADPDAVRQLVRELLPDAVPADLSSLETVLPGDVQALYQTAGAGDLVLVPTDESRFYGMRITPLDDVATREYLNPKARYLSWQFGAPEVFPPDPDDRVQPLGSSPAWFVIGDDRGGNLYVVDLRPGPRGYVGQILFVDHETNGGARWLAPSLTELLAQRPTALAPLGSEDGLLVRLGQRKSMADVQPETEVLIVGFAAAPQPVDLAGLTGHRRIRTLTVYKSAEVANLDVVTSMPALEYLELDVPRWQRLLSSDQLPSTLHAAGLHGYGDWDATVEVVNALLTRWDRPRLDVSEVRLTVSP